MASLVVKARGIVLQRLSCLQEADNIVYILTQSGRKLCLRAHGIRKSRRRSSLIVEPGSLIHIDYYAKTDKDHMVSLKEGHIEERFTELKLSYVPSLLLSYLLELHNSASTYNEDEAKDIDGSTHSHSQSKMFVLLHGSIEELRRCYHDMPRALVLLIFTQVRLMKILGILGSQERCSHCDGVLDNLLQWKVPEAYFICGDCSSLASSEQAQMGQLIGLASQQRFSNFIIEKEKKMKIGDKHRKQFFLSLWKNLNLCLEAFFSLQIKSFRQIEQQLQNCL